ncbi:MAG: hypothetical protein M3163_15530 [Actinomycetota bacterium]|nr:hypothetical protein [Actinomycetota bacterium]
MAAGAVGVVTMTVGEKLEQRLTGRPDSHVPARTLERLLRLPEGDQQQPRSLNLLMHFGQGVILGSLRGIMANGGLRGPWSSAMFAVVRLTNDQTLENATGVGAPPWTWPRRELAIDLGHKAVYAFVTGLVADRLAARSGPGPGGEHARLRPGRHEGVDPVARPA